LKNEGAHTGIILKRVPFQTKNISQTLFSSNDKFEIGKAISIENDDGANYTAFDLDKPLVAKKGKIKLPSVKNDGNSMNKVNES